MRKIILFLMMLVVVAMFSYAEEFTEGYVLQYAEDNQFPSVMGNDHQIIAFFVTFDDSDYHVVKANMFMMNINGLGARIKNTTIDTSNKLQMVYQSGTLIIDVADKSYPCLILDHSTDGDGIGYFRGIGGYNDASYDELKKVLFVQFYFDGKLTSWKPYNY